MNHHHVNHHHVKYWTQQQGYKIMFGHLRNRPAGIAVCFNQCSWKVTAQKVDNYDHWVVCMLEIDSNLIMDKIMTRKTDNYYQVTAVIKELGLNTALDSSRES